MIHIATVGTGFIVEDFLEALTAVPAMTCTALFSRSLENAKNLADKFQITTIYTDYNALLKDNSIDIIYIASPNSLHFSYALEALNAGKHVLCEKPFTSTAKEARILIETAREKHLFLFEAITTLHLPNYKKLKEQLPEIGDLKLVQINFSQYSSRYDKLLAGEMTNIFNPDFSGGALQDINIYNLHFVLGLFGKANTVMYQANKAFNGIDTSGILTLSYNNFLCSCIGAKDSYSPNFALLQGTKGYLKVNSSTNQCTSLELGTKNGVISINKQEIPHRMVYELLYFSELFENNDWAQCMSDLEHSLLVIETAAAARKEAGIIFPADSK